MEIPTICRYCGGAVRLVSASKVYGPAAAARLGIERQSFYQCQNCNARVGCHPGSTRPLGNLANEALRMKRMETHHVFDSFWKERGMSRTQAYMGVLLRKMLENLEEYDDPPVLTRVEKTISGFLFAYGGRDNQEDGPCVVYIVSETPVLPAKNKEEMK